MRLRDFFDRAGALGSGSQAVVPGAYAWAVTVAPVAWFPGGTAAAKVASVAALAALGFGWVAKRRWGERFKAASFWMFVVSSATAWSAAPAAMSPLRTEGLRGLAGMLGWGLFAWAWAAPAVEAQQGEAFVDEVEPLSPRRRLAPADAVYLAVGALAAIVFQIFGWRATTAERALLVRVVAVAAGLAVIDATAVMAFRRHERRRSRSRAVRFRSALVSLVMLGVLALAGLLFAVRG
jgi:hypothetical protein